MSTAPPTWTDWTLTNPAVGNEWRKKADGAECLSFPIWLYCDDTSGNTSKRWNAHNSFLFTAAGLPRSEASKEYNVHFLATSNSAPTLEMLDGIADQLQCVFPCLKFCQEFHAIAATARRMGFGHGTRRPNPVFFCLFASLLCLGTIQCKVNLHVTLVFEANFSVALVGSKGKMLRQKMLLFQKSEIPVVVTTNLIRNLLTPLVLVRAKGERGRSAKSLRKVFSPCIIVSNLS